ncbi:MAG: phosphatidate cytidylyltransferase [Treponema sp.]
MNVKKVLERLTVFFIGFPATVSVIYFLPYYHFLCLHILIFAVTVTALVEIYSMLKKRVALYPFPVLLIGGSAFPVISYLNTITFFPRIDALFTVSSVIYFIFLVEIIYSFRKSFEKSIERIVSGIFMMFYPGFFLSFVLRMARWEGAAYIITLFVIIIFTCDSMAWLSGVLFGKTNKGFIPASPNKSIAGFIGGVVGSALISALTVMAFRSHISLSVFNAVLIAVATSVAGIFGDLIESVIKRSANMKDSGAIILGRGGIMDSVDSILLGAPAFYIMYLLCSGV